MSPTNTRSRLLWLLCWFIPAGLAFWIYHDGLRVWFHADDFVWMNLLPQVEKGRSVLDALFRPSVHGTFRPFSERGFFLLFHWLFGLNPKPFRICVFLTYMGTLALLVSVLKRMTGSYLAGFFACVFWVVNPAMVTVMAWNSSYMHVLCPFVMLLALRFLLLHVETGDWRYYWMQLAVFVFGFGVMESNVVYPAIAAGYVLLSARQLWKRLLPLFAISVAFLAFHTLLVPKQQVGAYSLHIDASMFRTFASYWKWAVFPLQAGDAWIIPDWFVLAAALVITSALGVFLGWECWKRRWLTLYLFAWFGILIGPMLPLPDHRQYYYLTLPLMGLCSFAGYAVSRGWQAGWTFRVPAILLAATYAVMSAPVARYGTQDRYDISKRAERIVRAVGETVKSKPGVTVVLSGVDSDTFWWSVWDKPFSLVGAERVFLMPGSERLIESRPGVDNVTGYVLDTLPKNNFVVLAANLGMRDITASLQPTLPLDRIDVAHPLMQQWLGEGWHKVENKSRWMAKRATLHIRGPKAASSKLEITGYCVPENIKDGPLHLTVSVDSVALPMVTISDCVKPVVQQFALPVSVVGKKSMEVVLEMDRTLHPPNDPRELGLIFGTFEIK